MKQRVTILGAGPAGLWTALSLLERSGDYEITVIEKEDTPGGITASFKYKGLTFDYGSHRLHPVTSPDILDKILEMLGNDLLRRPRNGRIRLEGRFISFPLKPLDLIFQLPPSFSLGVMFDSISAVFRRQREGINFEDTLLSGLGRTISSRFYFPYARKLWGLPPCELSPLQARKRIESGSIRKMIGKALSSLTRNSGDTGTFYYPRQGFGQIAREAASRIAKRGGKIIYGTEAVSVTPPVRRQSGVVVTSDGRKIENDFIFSTIPVSDLIDLLMPAVPAQVLKEAEGLSFRSMVFCFLEVKGRQYTPFDAHYFPGSDTCFSRLSEPKNYSLADEPSDRTGLCFEIPCGRMDKIWELDDEAVLARVLCDLKNTDLPEPEVVSFTVRRKGNVYPVYNLDFSSQIDVVETFLGELNHIVSLGRQGLFVHDNTHHTIEMGIAAADCLSPELEWDRKKWTIYRDLFDSHVVVD
ncbi:MAG: FAD-dependent oxidoreductase [Candidatus Aegiribacteria sp.]|nr:FAD-dependent oxidoreductase [Candidatus Aegiribacteria sp.]